MHPFDILLVHLFDKWQVQVAYYLYKFDLDRLVEASTTEVEAANAVWQAARKHMPQS